MALVSYSDDESLDSDADTDNNASSSYMESDNVEPEYRMRVPKSAKLPSLIPELTTQRSKTGKILLSIPNLDTLDSSSDDDELGDGNPSKSQRTNNRIKKPASQPAVGLLAILPPVHNRDGHKRPMLIPQQLTVKRTVQPAKANEETVQPLKSDSSSRLNGNISDESDDDGSHASFFSFYKPEDETVESVASVRAAAVNNALRSISASDTVPPNSVPSEEHSEHTRSQRPLLSSSLPAPKTQTPSLCSIDPEVLNEFDVPRKVVPADDEEDVEPNQFWTDQTFVPGPERKRARLAQPGIRSLPVSEILRTSSQPIREVNQAELTAGADIELMKSVTSDESQYVSQRAMAEDEPGKLAHRKHQITWLAHQAQANEMELEKRWAEARRNKASNRAKYGF